LDSLGFCLFWGAGLFFLGAIGVALGLGFAADGDGVAVGGGWEAGGGVAVVGGRSLLFLGDEE